MTHPGSSNHANDSATRGAANGATGRAASDSAPRSGSTPADGGEPSRYLIGIDLGTTNSAVAYIDARERWSGDPPVRSFEVPQLVAEGAVAHRATLPSFLYLPGAHELPEGATVLPWTRERRYAVGEFARNQGARVPGRLVSSAKSWLCHGDVDRTAAILPWGGADDVDKLSPVAVSARYLQHVREAWDAAMATDDPELEFARQDVVLTVPASFDEVARELTLEAAHEAGIERVTLLEEPQAAFYAWLASHSSEWAKVLHADQVILVCDVGGGTTDFSLIVVREGRQGLRFERVAVGEHLMLGGDNMDLAIARLLEERLKAQGAKLDAQTWAGLTHACRGAKETLLGETAGGPTFEMRHPAGWPSAPAAAGDAGVAGDAGAAGAARRSVPVGVMGGGSSVVGGFIQSELTADEARRVVVDGFFPRVDAGERPERRRSGLREWGLPYVADAAITRHLAEFLARHRASVDPRPDASVTLARPDLVLWNGAALTPPAVRERLLDVVTAWFAGEDPAYRPTELANPDLQLAVARGAAYYGAVRRGRGVRIHGGSARGYYVAVEGIDAQDPETEDPVATVCLVRRGTEEGETIELARAFEAHVNRPVAFSLYSSSVRTDQVADVVVVARDSVVELPPIRTVLRFGTRAGERRLPVRLVAHLTEVGTLELFCSSEESEHRWRLRFQVRRDPGEEAAAARTTLDQGVTLDETLVEAMERLVREAFVPREGVTATREGGAATTGAGDAVAAEEHAVTPQNLMRRLRDAIELDREQWPLAALRKLAELLLEVREHRRRSAAHEARWLNLVGFCLRPGFGYPMDDWRMRELWKISHAGVLHPGDERCRTEWWILWRRVAGGLSAGQQEQLVHPMLAPLTAAPGGRGAGGARQGKGGRPSKGKGRTRGGKAGGRGTGKGGGQDAAGFIPRRLGKQERVEMWMCAASLENVEPARRSELGREIVARIAAGKPSALDHWALARIGARVPFHGHVHRVVGRKTVEGWIATLLDTEWHDPESMAHTLAHLARRSGDRERDVGDALRERLVTRLGEVGDFPRAIELVTEGGELGGAEDSRIFGETLPAGLVLVDEAVTSAAAAGEGPPAGERP